MARYFIDVQYQGTSYRGWQVQKNANSVQGMLNKALSTILKQVIDCIGSSRTDSGVHAKQNMAHFDAKGRIPLDFLYRMNSYLPNDIHLKALIPVKLSAHARFDAVSREYKYLIHFQKDPFREGLAYRYRYGALDLRKMNRVTKYLLTEEDYSSFCKARTQVQTKICKVTHAAWTKDGDLLTFSIRANRFLRGMVRGIVGSSILVGSGKLTSTEFKQIIKSRDPKNTDFSAPAQGLYLNRVQYPYELKARSFGRKAKK